jgi:hypothetical protein
MSNLAKSDELNPVIYRPLSTASYLVKEYVTVPGLGSTPVTKDSLNFNLIAYPLNGMTFNTTGTDSMVVIVKTVNETPMKYRYKLYFTGTSMDSGSKTKYLSAATINSQGDVIEASRDSLEFKLNSNDVANLAKATEIDLSITLYQPSKGPVLANVLKNSQITFYIGFRAPVNLFKVKL